MRYCEIVAETIDDYILRRYLRGKCFAFAVALHRRIKKPFYGLFDASGDLHHVFLADPSTRQAYDVRGIVSLDDVGKGSEAEADAVEPRPITRPEAESVYGSPARADVIEAGKVIDRMLWKWQP
jgi:hypothetical protein